MSFDLRVYSSGFEPGNRRNFVMLRHRAQIIPSGHPNEPSYKTACGRTLRYTANPRILTKDSAYLQPAGAGTGVGERVCGHCFPKGTSSDAD